MICWSGRVYHDNKDKEIEEDTNPHYGEPFSAFRGHVLFRACHCPGKSTVFGIEKQNQDVYNKEELAEPYRQDRHHPQVQGFRGREIQDTDTYRQPVRRRA